MAVCGHQDATAADSTQVVDPVEAHSVAVVVRLAVVVARAAGD